MTVYSTFKKLHNQLEKLYEVREAANIADLVIEYITKQSKIWRIINKNKELTAPEIGLFMSISEKLLENVPVQYVLNESWFGGMKFFVNKSVLIPRPETEELIDWITTDFQTIASSETPLKVIDIGTGSGCIPITLKKKFPSLQVLGIDISQEAIDVAQRNAYVLNVEIDFVLNDFLDERNWNGLGKFDLIISNPPYIKQIERFEMNNRVVHFEPNIALFVPDNDPLLFYRKIALFAKQYLIKEGTVFVEINEALGEETCQLFNENGFFAELKRDLQGKDRMIKAKLFT